jgi:hypothetical protein
VAVSVTGARSGAISAAFPRTDTNKTHLERDMLLGAAWDTIDIANPIALKLGVLICLDYLSRDAAPFRAYVGDKIGACRLLAVPSLTPHHTIGEFNARSTSEAKRLGRAVVYANIANGGGTSILVDSGMDMPHAEFPYGIPELARCEEGIVVADIDCELTAPDEKPSRLFSDRTAAVPIAAALLRYATVEEEVSANTQMARIFGQCDMNSCLSLSNAVESNDTALRQLADQSPQTRQLRLNMLLDRHDQEGGPWFDREDKFQLVELASRVPGPLPAVAAHSIFDQQSSEDLQQIERALSVSQNMPIGMLAIATAFAMLTVCNNKPLENVASMTMALVGLLGRESSDTSEKDTLASIEPVALQRIGPVVSRFTLWRTSIAEHAWLTTRLYEWWMREADVANVRPFLSRMEVPGSDSEQRSCLTSCSTYWKRQ